MLVYAKGPTRIANTRLASAVCMVKRLMKPDSVEVKSIRQEQERHIESIKQAQTQEIAAAFRQAPYRHVPIKRSAPNANEGGEITGEIKRMAKAKAPAEQEANTPYQKEDDIYDANYKELLGPPSQQQTTEQQQTPERKPAPWYQTQRVQVG